MTRKIVMSKLKHVITLLNNGTSYSKISTEVGVSKGYLSKIRYRIDSLPITIEELLSLEPHEINKLIYPPTSKSKAEPDWDSVSKQVKKKGVTVLLSYEHFCNDLNPTQKPLAYSSFCRKLNKWRKSQEQIEAQSNATPAIPGEKLEIDYSGDSFKWVSPDGEIHTEWMFVAILPASQLFFAFPTPKKTRKDWIEGIIQALHYIGGAPQFLICDNDTALSDKVDRYEGVAAKAIIDLCEHYGMKPNMCAPRKPKQKNRVEAAVNWTQRWILAELSWNGYPLFKDRDALIDEIKRQCDLANERVFSKSVDGLSRRTLFSAVEMVHLQTLPAEDYEVCEWMCLVVDKAHCIKIHKDGHRYSTPTSYIGKKVYVRLSQKTVTLFDIESGKIIGTHVRRFNSLGLKTHLLEEHMTDMEINFRRDSTFFTKSVAKLGVDENLCDRFFTKLFNTYNNSNLANRPAYGVLKLSKEAHNISLIAKAMEMTLAFSSCSFQKFKDIFEKENDAYNVYERQKKQGFEELDLNYQNPEHQNIRNNYH